MAAAIEAADDDVEEEEVLQVLLELAELNKACVGEADGKLPPDR